MKKMLGKKTTKVVLLEVPKGMDITDTQIIEKLDLGERMKKASKNKSNNEMHKVKIANKDQMCMAMTDLMSEDKKASALTQILMLFPDEAKAAEDEACNLQVSTRGLDAHIKVSLMPKESVKMAPVLSFIKRQKPKEKK